VVQAADPRQGDDAAHVRRFRGARDRRIAAERHMGSVLVVVDDMLVDQAEQMPLPEHDDVIEQLSAQRAYPPLGESVLPRRARRDPELLDAQIVHPCETRTRRSRHGLARAAPARRQRR